MKKRREKGFVLLIAITSLTLIGFSMLLLTRSSRTMLFDTDTVFGESWKQNLTASALVWARENVKAGNIKTFDKAIELDSSNMSIRNAKLAVTINMQNDNEAKVTVTAVCSRGRRTFKVNKKYLIKL